MLTLSLSAIANVCQGQLKGMDGIIGHVTIDSRSAQLGSLFVALQGEKQNGHDFVQKAAEQGACAALVEYFVDAPISQIKVDNCCKALGQIANHYRQSFTGKVLALTGSSGKTSTCQMLKSILAEQGSVNSTLGNFNNDLGLPLSILAADNQADFSVFEMGAAQVGDIARLVAIAQPDISAITNIGTAHIGRFGSRDKIALAKSEIYQLAADGLACINLDDDYAGFMQQQTSAKTLSFSVQQQAEVYASAIELLPEASCYQLHYQGQALAISLPVPGLHNISNSLCAAAMALAAGVSLQVVRQGLAHAHAVAGRLESKIAFNGARIIDDSYNANCQSVKVAIDILAAQSGKKVLVLGDMAELGNLSESLHSEVGLYAKEKRIDNLYACGHFSQFTCRAYGASAHWFSDKTALIDKLKQQLSAEQVVLIKGSHSSAMTEVVQALEAESKLCY